MAREITPTKREIKRIGIGGIHRLPSRFRAVNPDNVKIIAGSMKEVGLINPLTVRVREGNNGYWLIAGAHRLAAAKKLGWTGIDCVVLEGLEQDQAELLAVDENLARPELTPAERARHIAYRKELYERLHPETRKGGDRKSQAAKDQSANSALRSFAEDTAAKTGRSKRSVAQDAQRGKALGDDLSRIAGTSLDKGTELDALASMTPKERAPLIAAAEQGETVTAIRSSTDPATSDSRAVAAEVNKRTGKLDGFLSDYCIDAERWFAENRHRIGAEGRDNFMMFLMVGANRLLDLHQKLDGR